MQTVGLKRPTPLERHVIATLVDSAGNVRFERTAVVDVATISDPRTAGLRHLIEAAGLQLLLISPLNDLPIHTFMAVILDPNPCGNASMVNIGYGSHLSAARAAMRAITEAAQVRLTFVHASREDLPPRAYAGGESRRSLFSFFSRLGPDTNWNAFEDLTTGELSADFARVVQIFADGQFGGVYRADLSCYPGIHVVKALVEGSLEQSTRL